MSDDPFGDPFAQDDAPIVKKAVAKPAVKAAVKPATAAAAVTASPVKPAVVAAKKPVSSSFDDDVFGDPFAAPTPATKAPAKAAAAATVAASAAASTPSPTTAPAPVVAPKPVVVAVEPPKPRTPEPLPEPVEAAVAPAVAEVPAVVAQPLPPPPQPVASAAKKPVAAAEPSFGDEDDDPFASAFPVKSSTKAPAKAPVLAPAVAAPKPDDIAVAEPEPEVEPVREAEPSPSADADDASDEPAVLDETPAPVASVSSPPPPALPSDYIDSDDDVREDELSLEGSDLSVFPEDVIRARGATLRRVDLTDNKLTSLKSLAWPFGAPAWPKLEELILDKNQLEGLSGCGQIPSLNTLWINNNKINDLDALLDSVEKWFPRLTYLSMLRNPACPDMYFSDGEHESYQRFRLYVIYRLKNLAFLDSTPVTPEERKEATLRGAYCRVAKPMEAKPAASSKSAASPTAASAASTPGGASPSSRQSKVGLDPNQTKPPKVATFLAKGKPRYDGTNSEGNRFIMNDDL